MCFRRVSFYQRRNCLNDTVEGALAVLGHNGFPPHDVLIHSLNKRDASEVRDAVALGQGHKNYAKKLPLTGLENGPELVPRSGRQVHNKYINAPPIGVPYKVVDY